MRQVCATTIGMQHIGYAAQKVETVPRKTARSFNRDKLEANRLPLVPVPRRAFQGPFGLMQQLDYPAMIPMTYAEYGIASVFGAAGPLRSNESPPMPRHLASCMIHTDSGEIPTCGRCLRSQHLPREPASGVRGAETMTAPTYQEVCKTHPRTKPNFSQCPK